MPKALAMVHDDDPRQALKEKLGSTIDHVVPLGTGVMVAVYKRPERTKSGLYLADNTRGEDDHQGKVGLVLRCGPTAFEEDASHRFGGLVPKQDDWIIYSVGETFAFMLGDVKVRIVEDVHIRAIVDQPDIVL